MFDSPLSTPLTALASLREQLKAELEGRELKHLLRRLESVQPMAGQKRTGPESPSRATIQVNGQILIHFASNDYLGLASDLSFWQHSIGQMSDQCSFGAGASPLIIGRGLAMEALEQKLAAFECTETALLFSSGFAANHGTISTLIGKEDVLFSDQLNHASIVDGCRSSSAQRWVYAHNDMNHLASLLAGHRHRGRRAWIVTDSVFSMTGDLAPLPELAKLAQNYDALVLVDEAHATGIYGRQGSGLCDELKVSEQVAVRIGTLSKAIGCMGGFVVSDSIIHSYLVNFCRPYIYSTALSPAIAVAAKFAIERLMLMDSERTSLRSRSTMLRRCLQEQGWQVPDGDSPIIPLVINNDHAVLELSQFLRQKGIWVPAIRPPTVPAGQAMLRISITSLHSTEDYERLLDALAQCPTVRATG